MRTRATRIRHSPENGCCPPVLLPVLRKHRNKSLVERPLGKQPAQEVGNLEGDEERIRCRTSAEITGNNDIPGQSQHAGNQGKGCKMPDDPSNPRPGIKPSSEGWAASGVSPDSGSVAMNIATGAEREAGYYHPAPGLTTIGHLPAVNPIQKCPLFPMQKCPL